MDRDPPSIRAEQSTAADAFQRPLRFRFQVRLSGSVGLQSFQVRTEEYNQHV
jgi:hypothetical protein